jgi:hypothetical protein
LTKALLGQSLGVRRTMFGIFRQAPVDDRRDLSRNGQAECGQRRCRFRHLFGEHLGDTVPFERKSTGERVKRRRA